MNALANIDFSPLTLERYETSLRHTLKFMKVSAGSTNKPLLIHTQSCLLA